LERSRTAQHGQDNGEWIIFWFGRVEGDVEDRCCIDNAMDQFTVIEGCFLP
jgi:hypothetical protein